MSAEIKALKNCGCWRVVETPRGIRLSMCIKSNAIEIIELLNGNRD